MHPVDSNEISFKLAARNAFKEAFRNAGPKIMEPIYDVEVLTPSDYMGAVMSEGGMENMLSGKCDENWAKQNHNLWYAKIQGQNK